MYTTIYYILYVCLSLYTPTSSRLDDDLQTDYKTNCPAVSVSSLHHALTLDAF